MQLKKLVFSGRLLIIPLLKKSDIDIIVELEKPIGWKFFTLEMFLETTFGRKVDLVTKNALREQIKDRILNQVKYA